MVCVSVFLSPRAVNINASNECLELAFKVIRGLVALPVLRLACRLAQASSFQVWKRESGAGESSGTTRSLLAAGLRLALAVRLG